LTVSDGRRRNSASERVKASQQLRRNGSKRTFSRRLTAGQARRASSLVPRVVGTPGQVLRPCENKVKRSGWQLLRSRSEISIRIPRQVEFGEGLDGNDTRGGLHRVHGEAGVQATSALALPVCLASGRSSQYMSQVLSVYPAHRGTPGVSGLSSPTESRLETVITRPLYGRCGLPALGGIEQKAA